MKKMIIAIFFISNNFPICLNNKTENPLTFKLILRSQVFETEQFVKNIQDKIEYKIGPGFFLSCLTIIKENIEIAQISEHDNQYLLDAKKITFTKNNEFLIK